MVAVNHTVFKLMYPRDLRMATRLPQYLATFTSECPLTFSLNLKNVLKTLLKCLRTVAAENSGQLNLWRMRDLWSTQMTGRVTNPMHLTEALSPGTEGIGLGVLVQMSISTWTQNLE